MAALIEGVLLHGTSWAAIYDSCVATGRINPGRKKVGPMCKELAGWEGTAPIGMAVAVCPP